ncbi:MAG: peptidoglycan bridge formation glycyltransferase FemA/FemB family protein [Ruminococcus sp.]|nr:peptidoglycan bridge formation glycyltransferase FemA/FemB family protein [Ruminococcus sp.]
MENLFTAGNTDRKNEGRTEFEAFCEQNGNFMQSACWAQVKKGWQAEYITAKRGDRITGTMLILMKKLPLINSTILYAPRGPVCDYRDRLTLLQLKDKVKKLAKEHNACFLKIDPLIDQEDHETAEMFRSLGFILHTDRVGYDNIQCRENYMLDIGGKTADEVFASFKPKWRYNIRLSARRGVTCGFYGEEKLDDFCRLMAATAMRDGFEMRGVDYFRNLLRSMNGHAGLCMAYLGEQPLAGALYIEYNGTMSYVYGCSSNKERSCMPNYMMQWTMIEKAVGDGCQVYDFMGVPYWYDEKHHNYGVYHFKQGFNGYVKTYIGEMDLVFKPLMYRLYNAAWWLKKHI